jgi:hypothetical protein
VGDGEIDGALGISREAEQIFADVMELDEADEE